MSCGQQITIKRPNHKHLASDITDFEDAVHLYSPHVSLSSTSLYTNSAYWEETYSNVQENSACWNDACAGITIFQDNSGSYDSGYSTVNSLSTFWGGGIDNTLVNMNVQSNSANWNIAFTRSNIFSQNSANYDYQGTDIKSLTANWQNNFSVYSINSATYQDIDSVVQSNSASWLLSGISVETDPIFTSWLQSNSGNYDSVFYSVCSLSASWSNNLDNTEVNTLVQENSSNWDYQGTDIKSLTGNWESTFNDYYLISSTYQNTNTVVQNNSALWTSSSDNVEVNNFVISNSSLILDISSTVQNNSADWNYRGTDIKSISSDWQNTFLTVNSNSANWGGSAISLPNSANWDDTYTIFSTQSANNASVFITVNSNSASNWNYQGSDVKSLTANWQNTYGIFSTNSAIYQDVDLTVQANSAAWLLSGISVETDPIFATWAITNSANFYSVYTTVNDNSALNWNYQGTDIKSLTGYWDNAYTTFSVQSANNVSVYTTVQTNSASWQSPGISNDYYPLSGGILNGSLLTNSIVSANSADFNVIKFPSNASTPSWEEGRVFYDASQHTLAYYNDDSGMTVNVGQEQIVRVYNGESVQINNGQVVYVDGSHGNTPRVFLADANYTSSTSDKILGIATTDLPATGNRTGYITTHGIVHDIGTGPTSYTEGDNIFLSLTPGTFTATSPTKPNHIIDLGIIIGTSGGGSNNRVDVYVKMRHIEHISDLCDVIPTILSANDVLLYNPLSGGYWYNSTSNNWQDTYTNFSTQSANNISVYTTVNDNSATNWNYQGNDVKSLTANYEDVSTIVKNNSAQWAIDIDNSEVNNFVFSNSATILSVDSAVQTNSAVTWNYQGTDIKALTGNYSSVYTNVNTNSSNWNNTYTTFSTQSAYNSNVYNTVNANSAVNWNYQGNDVKSLTANYQSVYSTVNANSSQWIKFEYSAALSDETTSLTTGNSALTFRMPCDMYITEARASVRTAPTGSPLIVDILQNNTSIFSTLLSIDVSENTSTTAVTAAVISNHVLTDDSPMRIAVTQVGSTIAGTGLKILMKGYRT